MKLLFLISSDKHTGPGRAALTQARLLAERGHEVRFACRAGDSLAAAAQKAGLLWTEAGLNLSVGPRVWLYLADLRALRGLERTWQPDLVFVYRSAEHLTAGLAFGRRVPLVRFLHHTRQSRYVLTKSGLERTSVACVDEWTKLLLRRPWTRRILTPDPTILPELILDRGTWPPDAPLQVAPLPELTAAALQFSPAATGAEFVPGGIDLEYFHPELSGATRRAELDFGPDTVVAGMVGRLKPERGQELFLRALARAIRFAPQLRGLIAGEGECREELERLARELGLAEKVVFAAPGDQYAATLAALDVGAQFHPGSAGTAQAALELMCLGKPLIVCAEGVLGQLAEGGAAVRLEDWDWRPHDFQPGRTGVPPLVERLAIALAALAGSPELRGQRGEAGQRLMRERFSLAALGGQLEKLVGELAAGHGR